MAKRKNPQEDKLTTTEATEEASYVAGESVPLLESEERRDPPLIVKTEVKATPKKKKPNPNAVSLRIFLTASGVRLDQMAGFQNYAIKNKLGSRTMKEWRETYAEFLKRPIN